MSNTITFGTDLKEKLLAGIKKVSDCATSTLGPAGKVVIIESPLTGGTPTITKDGVTCIKSITLKDPVEELACSLLKNLAIRTNMVAGDGTTTTCLLASAITEEGLALIKEGANPIFIRNGINKAVDDVIEILHKQSRSITTKEEIKQVAMISANDDEEIGDLIATAVDNIGQDGVITLAESSTREDYIEYVEGMQFDRGYISPYFCTDKETMIVEYENPYILVYKGVIMRAKELLPILDACNGQGKPVLIVANDVQGEALTFLAYNNMQGLVKACAVKTPSYGDRQQDILEDIAVLTGATMINQEAGMSLEAATLSFLGKAASVRVDYGNTTIVDGEGDPAAIKLRVDKIKKEMASTTGYELEKLQERLAKLSAGIAVLHIGATTEVELKEKKHRVEDALNATRAAIAEGIIPGGGSTLYKISESIKHEGEFKNEDEEVGYEILVNALRKPFIKILANAGLADEDNFDFDTSELSKENYGFDVLNQKWVDMYEAGIIDPVKVTRTALENSASIISLALTSSCAITDNDDVN